MSDNSTTGVTDLSEDYPGQHITGPDTPPPATRKRSGAAPRGAPAKGKGKGKGKPKSKGSTRKPAKAGKGGTKSGPGARPGGKGADYAARAAKIVASREANRKAGIGSVRVQRAFAKAMRKAAGL